jgi:hypothetical protein
VASLKQVWAVALPTYSWRRSAKDLGLELRFDRDRSRPRSGHSQQHRTGRRDRVSVSTGLSESVWQRAKRWDGPQNRRLPHAGGISRKCDHQRDVSNGDGCQSTGRQARRLDAHGC